MTLYKKDGESWLDALIKLAKRHGREVEAQKAKTKEDHVELRILTEELREVRGGSSRRAHLEERIASRKADLQIRLKMSRKGLLEEEARIYDDV